MKPLFTISVLTHNKPELAADCIKSILSAKNESNYELLVTLNGIDKDVYSSCSFEGAQIIEHKSNIGFIKGHQVALQEAKGKYFLLLNDDTAVGDGWLDTIVVAFQDIDVKVVGPIGGILNEQGMGRASGQDEIPDYIEGCCLAVPTAFAKHFGLFWDRLSFAYCEDSELGLRVRAKGFKLKTVNTNFRHIGSATARKADADVQGYSIKNHYQLRNKWGHYLKTKSFEENYFITRAGAIGDVFMLSPIFEQIKKENVHAKITLITKAPQLMQGNRFVDEILNELPAAMPEGAKRFNLDLAYEKRPHTHIVDAYAEEIGIENLVTRLPQIFLTNEMRVWADQHFGTDFGQYIALHPGPTAWPGRNLPAETFEKVILFLKSEGYKVIEVNHTRMLKEADFYCDGYSFMQTAGVIRNSIGFIGIDSSPMHIAQAFVKPGAVVFGCIDPAKRLIHPHLLRPVMAEVGCLFCHHWQDSPSTSRACIRGNPECMTRITPEQIIQEFKKGLEAKMYCSETEKIKEKVLLYCQGKGLDIGCRDAKILPDAIGIDQQDYKGVDHVLDASKPLPFQESAFDYIFSSHCLEDIEDTERTLRQWLQVLKPGGNISLYLPHKDLYRGYNTDHMHEFLPEDITELLVSLGVEIVESYVDGGPDRYSFLVAGRKAA